MKDRVAVAALMRKKGLQHTLSYENKARHMSAITYVAGKERQTSTHHRQEGDGDTLLSGTSCTTDAMGVRLHRVGHVVVHDL